ncbi:hypothetical protein QSJ19_01485 [Gordonia sp. ABSL11-1]|uniref:hypothetical protein n=1 Tax=Gordonia sp. ABSL11-1 TaxID=3053924 RepID=UPI00257452A2|nr:hypothetical protein [Gordonia sp. ABSL11-1]MDL9944275.1 hypothetical protein [Gordonia sp. ABSL11-1]
MLTNLITDPVPTSTEVAGGLKADDSEWTTVARFASGSAESTVVRFDYLDVDGSLDTAYQVDCDWLNETAGGCEFTLFQQNWPALADMAAVLTAVHEFIASGEVGR